MTKDITIIDGGMGQELYRRSGKPASPLWSAQVMLDTPGLVIVLHREFIEAGAQIITLNSYAATPERLTRDADISSFEPLQKAALKAAHAARDQAGLPVRIAGCLPPLVASYHPELVPIISGRCRAIDGSLISRLLVWIYLSPRHCRRCARPRSSAVQLQMWIRPFGFRSR